MTTLTPPTARVAIEILRAIRLPTVTAMVPRHLRGAALLAQHEINSAAEAIATAIAALEAEARRAEEAERAREDLEVRCVEFADCLTAMLPDAKFEGSLIVDWKQHTAKLRKKWGNGKAYRARRTGGP